MDERERQETASAEVEALIRDQVPGFGLLAPADQERLRRIAADLFARRMPGAFVVSSLRSTADVLRELREDEETSDGILQREPVRRFIEQNAVTGKDAGAARPVIRGERRREERDLLQTAATHLLREARLARGRHEVKKTRNMLLKLDQRELRRVLGREGDDLCRQINTWLRSTAPLF